MRGIEKYEPRRSCDLNEVVVKAAAIMNLINSRGSYWFLKRDLGKVKL